MITNGTSRLTSTFLGAKEDIVLLRQRESGRSSSVYARLEIEIQFLAGIHPMGRPPIRADHLHRASEHRDQEGRILRTNINKLSGSNYYIAVGTLQVDVRRGSSHEAARKVASVQRQKGARRIAAGETRRVVVVWAEQTRSQAAELDLGLPVRRDGQRRAARQRLARVMNTLPPDPGGVARTVSETALTASGAHDEEECTGVVEPVLSQAPSMTTAVRPLAHGFGADREAGRETRPVRSW